METQASQFRAARETYGTREDAARALGVSMRQLRRYERGETAAPGWAMRLLRLLAGELGEINPQWEGWRLRGATLYPPWNQEFGLGWFLWLKSHVLRREARERRLEMRIAELEGEIERLNSALRAARDEPEQIDLFRTQPYPGPERRSEPRLRAVG